MMSTAWMRALPRLVVALAMAPVLAMAPAMATLVRVETATGPIDLDLYDTQAPLTVAKILLYVRGGDYDGSFFHRLARNGDGSGFVLQGGGYTYRNALLASVVSRGNITNEFSATRSNLRGTIAMAKLASGPDTATSEWFVNLGNNSANLDNQNGGFTVFGRVTPASMAAVDRISVVSVVNANGTSYSAFSELPLFTVPSGRALTPDDLVTMTKVHELATTTATDSDRVFNYLEAVFPQFIPLKGSFGGTGLGYYFRYYPATNSYVGTKDGGLFYLVPSISNDIGSLGNLADWLAAAQSNGY